MNPGSDMPCGAASSLTPRLPPASESRMPRRVASASAAKTVSSSSSEYLTIRFSIPPPARACQATVWKASITSVTVAGRTTRARSFPSFRNTSVGQSFTPKARPSRRPLASAILM